MNVDLALWLVLASVVIAANLPFVSERVFLFGPRRAPKPLGWHMLEWLIYCSVAVLIGRVFEARIGQVYSQGWEFYAVMLCLCLTCAFPGFVARHLVRRRSA